MAMPMPQTSSNPITQTGGVQAPDGHSATTTAQGQTPQPAPQGQPGAVPPYTGQSPVYGSGTAVIAGGECGCGTTVAYADGGARRRGLFRRY
jgi:hypothetical protein